MSLRVVVCDDSALARELLVEILEHDGDIAVVGQAKDGAEAERLVDKLRPDLATIDIHMPDVDGWVATERIMARSPTPILVVTARPIDAQLAFEALRRGALDAVWKPTAFDSEAARRLREHVRLLGRTPVVRHVRATTADPRPPLVPAPARSGLGAAAPRPPRVVTLAGSAGGPRALTTILGALPRTLPACLAVVQHLPAGFTAPFARFLASVTPLEVHVVERTAPLRAGTVYLAGEDRHLVVSRAAVAVDDGPPENGFRPSASVLFRSAAAAFGPAALGIILSGIGADGVDGLGAIVAAGGTTIAQSQESSIVYGMPRAAVAAGVSSLVLHVGAIAGMILERVR